MQHAEQPAPGLRVLVVEDDPILGDLFLDVLESSGHLGRLVRGGSEALALLAREAFDLVVSDLRMPEMSGRQLWERLRSEHPELASTMIFVSGEEPEAASTRFLGGMKNPYLKKPFNIQDLVQLVNRTASSGTQG